MEYIDRGVGKPILFFHGTPAGSDSILLFDSLTKDHRFISQSRPGYLGTPLGQSPGDDLDGQATKFKFLLDNLGLTKANLLAHSGGGPFALKFAEKFPERTESLILCSALVRADKIRRIARMMWQNWLLKLAGWASPKWKPYLQLMLPKKARIQGFDNDVVVFHNMPPFNFGAFACRALVLHDPEDRFVKFEQAELANTIPGSTLVRVTGGHFSMIGPDADHVFGTIREFIG